MGVEALRRGLRHRTFGRRWCVAGPGGPGVCRRVSRRRTRRFSAKARGSWLFYFGVATGTMTNFRGAPDLRGDDASLGCRNGGPLPLMCWISLRFLVLALRDPRAARGLSWMARARRREARPAKRRAGAAPLGPPSSEGNRSSLKAAIERGKPCGHGPQEQGRAVAANRSGHHFSHVEHNRDFW